MLKKSACGWHEELPDLILQGTNGTKGHLNGPTRRQDRVWGSSAGPFRIDNAYRRSVGKKFRAMRLQATFSTASAMNGSLSHAANTSAYPPTTDIQNGNVRFDPDFVCFAPRSRPFLRASQTSEIDPGCVKTCFGRSRRDFL